MKKLLPILLLLLGGGGGVAAGYFMRPPPPAPDAVTEPATPAQDAAAPACPEGAAPCPPAGADGPGASAPAPDIAGHAAEPAPASETTAAGAASGPEYVALQRQMIVPIVNDDQVISLVVMSLSIEVEKGFTSDVYDREPKLRDAFLQVLFRHANTGGFSGDFTAGEKMADLRRALNNAAAQVLGPIAIQVLVTDIMRQAT